MDILKLPNETIFKPPKSKLMGIEKKIDYLGKAKVFWEMCMPCAAILIYR